MRLYKLIEGLADINIPDREISSVTDNTKKVRKDCIFVCVKGGSFDGHDAAAEMLEKGAAVIVAERDLGLGNKQIITDNSRKFYGELCAAWFDHPEKKLKIIGVTGTNGKTTITNVIKNIFMKNGVKTGLIGTICNEIGDETVHTDNTTPMAFDYMCLLDKMVKAGCKYAVMEVSSFGLVQHRIGPTHFDMGIFTNLTQDHLDYHKTMENYYQAKKMMFDECDYEVIHMLENSNLCFDDLMAYSSAISSIEVYDDISFCNTGKDCPVIANISDFMLALKEVSFSVVYSRKSDGIKLSVRSEKSMLDAGKIVAEALKGIGNGGGHASMAGGFVPCTGSDMDVKLLEAQMKERFLNVIADVKKRAL